MLNAQEIVKLSSNLSIWMFCNEMHWIWNDLNSLDLDMNWPFFLPRHGICRKLMVKSTWIISFNLTNVFIQLYRFTIMHLCTDCVEHHGWFFEVAPNKFKQSEFEGEHLHEDQVSLKIKCIGIISKVKIEEQSV